MSEGTKLGKIQELSELNQQAEPTEDANLEATKNWRNVRFRKSLEEDNLEKSSLEVERRTKLKKFKIQTMKLKKVIWKNYLKKKLKMNF